MTGWPVAREDDPFGPHNLPYGVAETAGGRRVVVRIGAHALDLSAASAATEFGELFSAGSLDALLAAGRPTWRAVRRLVTELLTQPEQRSRIEPLLTQVGELELVMPFTVADYADFYASRHHAENVGRIVRPDGEPLTPNWEHLPLGYHGRSGTVVVSGTGVQRPRGQYRRSDGTVGFGPSRRLDFEAEVAFVVGAASTPGVPVPAAAFTEHVFGVCLLNDWSARDIQAWEYVPLGPFLGKSFATSVSGWVTPLEALAGAWIDRPAGLPAPLPYLDDPSDPGGLDLRLEVRINGSLIARPPFSAMHWTPAQLLAHLTVNGAHLRTGDLFASGTVSGARRDERGCLLELSWNGAEPVALSDGSSRQWLEDGDEVLLTATAPTSRGTLALGEVRARVRPAADPPPGA